jgi:hypothetical protein
LADTYRSGFKNLANKTIVVVPNGAADFQASPELGTWPGRPGATQVGFVGRPFTGKGIEGGVATGVVGGTGPVDLNTVVTSAEADEQPQLLSAGPKRTPPGMEGVPARVQFEFIVDTLGRAESRSIKVLNSTNKLFEEPAREMVLKSVFKPGRQGGRPVRVLVTQAVTFQ